MTFRDLVRGRASHQQIPRVRVHCLFPRLCRWYRPSSYEASQAERSETSEYVDSFATLPHAHMFHRESGMDYLAETPPQEYEPWRSEEVRNIRSVFLTRFLYWNKKIIFHCREPCSICPSWGWVSAMARASGTQTCRDRARLQLLQEDGINMDATCRKSRE